MISTRELLALTMIKGLGPAFFKKNRDVFISDNFSFDECIKSIDKDYTINYLLDADKIIQICEQEGIMLISICSPQYPKLLFEISNPPTVLYIKGNLSLIDHPIAIIGTRHSTDLGNRIAEKLGAYFSQRYAICNGLVEGIDEHSIYVNDKILPNVIGIISGGLCYSSTCSKKHIRVIEDVLNNKGLIISEYPPYQKEDKFSGSKASRIQAGLSKGLILVQSKIDGGSKYTIDTFAKLNRVLGIIHFEQSDEYKTDSFSANRLIIEKKYQGIAELTHKKEITSIKIKDIVPITGKNDYEKFCHLLQYPDSQDQKTNNGMLNIFDN